MIAPNQLAHRVEKRFLVDARPNHVAGDRAPLRSVKPAVWSPTKTVCDGVRVLETEASEMHFGIAVGNVIVIPVRIKEQVRRVHYPDTAAAAANRRANIQAFDKSFMRVENAVAVGVLVDRDLVGANEMMRRWRRHLVVDGAPEIVATE